ncbi:MAG: hypothetical protein A3D24_03515 [Candidatus Blackburnbacteria bacterium RIFCSPHIGHO2_02_FULL_39_13]|uniref:1,4-alpha-glucan branching enzyme n=2 Tax=Patescibacteria group TaxID=1783273 RepID=A0A0G1A569_9BACT|nr:MAG: hypothetical protein UV20_C0017G0008 [Candidatus Magasanikbacteria bacterium GW2011_GWA2_42_32]OGY07036.1 MAG: hypothetical protein A2694_02145 [Candidatus Blackburnbacteria bacterium RIFCSPHIGHO2_01_FULL_40_17]OGY08160.1 MAG: hypothetical protein A3D24_03515 [Candidatus Blackburnbacteria bacterium RIFCSPHIGHO2_02_FULL_39_13]OGY13420.1 MAG: hypothetical protein A3A77_04595 [Candidatus Blackburnbacteria bacterium RIFCSPLOWO2_01_FULL_40_20]OGY14684.1 MAG: hypothetical protein A3I52_02170 
MPGEPKITTDHDQIKTWVEARGGKPAKVKGTGNGEGGLLRIDFGAKTATLEEISWDEFFKTFDSKELGFLYQDQTAKGQESRFFKFVVRSHVAKA